jgi:Ubiquitin carboxyl-terminal hydrolase, family 1
MQELLAMVPKLVKAVLMLFPITDATEAAKDAEEERVKANGQTVAPGLWYSRQTVSNACGTVAMLHAYANNPDVEPAAGSFLGRFLEATKDMTPDERARFLEHPEEGEPDIEEAHQEAAQEGQSAPPPEDEQVPPRSHAVHAAAWHDFRICSCTAGSCGHHARHACSRPTACAAMHASDHTHQSSGACTGVTGCLCQTSSLRSVRWSCKRCAAVQVLLHYVCFVHKDGDLYELDGRKTTPINHGSTTPDSLLQDSCKVVQQYVEATGSIRFTLIALAAASDTA